MAKEASITRKVLLADDEEGILALVVATLKNEDRYHVLVARDGQEALMIARQEKPDLVMLDILMPRMDGDEVCRALKADPATAQITVVLLTALDQEVAWRRGLEAGANDYLTKPFSPTALLEKVEEILGD